VLAVLLGRLWRCLFMFLDEFFFFFFFFTSTGGRIRLDGAGVRFKGMRTSEGLVI
jgi:hypothetical protein